MKLSIKIILGALLLTAIVCVAQTNNAPAQVITDAIHPMPKMSNVKMWIVVIGAICTAAGSVLVHGYQIVTTAGGFVNIINRLKFGANAPLITGAPAPKPYAIPPIVAIETQPQPPATAPKAS